MVASPIVKVFLTSLVREGKKTSDTFLGVTLVSVMSPAGESCVEKTVGPAGQC